MGLSQLRYSIAVAKLSGMSRAAKALSVSQSDLGISISRLEKGVGAPLFKRQRGKATLNQNSELLLRSVEQAASLLGADVQTVWN